MRQFFRSLQRFFLSERGQVAFAVILLILVPVALVLNTTSAISSAKRDMDYELRRKALLVEQVFQTATRDLAGQQAQLQSVIASLQTAHEEIWGIDVLTPQGDNFVVFASAVPETVGTTTSNLNAVIAWHEEKAIAVLTTSSDRATIRNQIQPNDGETRYWIVVNPMRNTAGEKIGLVSMKFSSKVVDDLVRSSVTRATAILVVTVAVVILLLAVNSKLFQYTVLFEKLKEVDQMKDEFISVASHELRTPITAIRGYLEMVLDGSFGPIPDQAKSSLRIVDQSAERLAVLVEDLLNVSRIEQGRLDLELADVDPLPVLREVIAELMPMASEKQLRLAYAGPDTLPVIKVNRDRFKQVLVNLVGNGLKYTPKGSVTVEPELKDDALRIKVADTGVGMSPKDLERLFTKFYRIRTEQTKDIGGTGLGLWITKQIVEKMNGGIEVESIEGVGSQFIVTFPAAAAKPTGQRA